MVVGDENRVANDTSFAALSREEVYQSEVVGITATRMIDELDTWLMIESQSEKLISD